MWHGLNQRGGVDADNILQSATTFEVASKVEKKGKTLQIMVNQMNRFLGSRVTPGKVRLRRPKEMIKNSGGCFGKRVGSYLMVLYMVSKLLYIANIIGQLFVLNYVFRTSYHSFGADFIRDALSRRPWIDNTHFPRVTFCDFPVRRLGNVHRYTVQCVLPLNLFLEIIYVFLWFWMVALAIVTCLNFAVWLIRAAMYSDRIKFIQNHLRVGDRIETSSERHLVDRFVGSYLRQDGCLILRLIAHNTNNITVTEIVCAMWDFWRDKIAPPSPDLENGNETDMLKPKVID